MASPSMKRITRMNFILGGLLVIGGALTQPKDMALGIAVGVALTLANFFVLSRVISRWTADVAKGSTSSAQMFMAPKMGLLMLAVVLSLKYLPIDPIGFAIGYSVFVLSITIEAIYCNMLPPKEESEEANGHG